MALLMALQISPRAKTCSIDAVGCLPFFPFPPDLSYYNKPTAFPTLSTNKNCFGLLGDLVTGSLPIWMELTECLLQDAARGSVIPVWISKAAGLQMGIQAPLSM